MDQFYVDKSQCNHRRPFPGVQMFTACGEKMTLSIVEMEPAAEIPSHSHPHEQVGMMLEGSGQFDIGDQSRLVKAGEMWRIPGGTPHRIVAGDKGLRALDVFHPIREDYR
ncbi:MAG TPA: cupin domain-containing protein [Pirellulales bacterium]|jgi:quercetin dioxygenase-like cupin family protein|nr:cupin domain-containing protein [Pirellulales bacterium]